ncbi:MAG TPA: PilZ domain-containing protein [Sphingomicrobium sp.]|nr:PilZ domain-containing protein [Sphingomicrobium sp.]
MTERISVTTFVMGPRLPWPDDSRVLDDEGPFESGVIHNSGFRQDCSIRKISTLGATVRSKVQNAPGEELTVELPSGQRTAATVEWARGGETGIRFAKPIDVLALINRNLVNQPIDRRAMPRVEIRCSAYIKRAEDFVAATVRNISAGGLQLEGDSLPPAGTYVSVFLDGLNVPPGEIAWRKDKLAGIELFEELSWASIMPWIRETVKKQAN